MFWLNVADKYASAVTKKLGFWPCSAGPLWLQILIRYYYINFLKMSMKLQNDLSRLCCHSIFYFRLDFFELLMTFHQFRIPKHLWLPYQESCENPLITMGGTLLMQKIFDAQNFNAGILTPGLLSLNGI